MNSTDLTKVLISNILNDIRVEMADEFDRNFTRQAFFSKAWQRRKSPSGKGRAILADTGSLRRSIGHRTTPQSVIFETTLPYADIHNEGGVIKITSRMRKFFWAKYYEATNGLQRTSKNAIRNNKHNKQLNTLAEFWRAMALKPIGSEIKMPERRFLGINNDVLKIVDAIVNENLDDFLQNYIPDKV